VTDSGMSARRASFGALAIGALGLAGMLVAPDAAAQEDRVDPLASRHKTYESPQNFAFEIRFSPYKPDVDSDPALGGNTPYATVFGTAPRLFVGAEFDWEALRIPHFGTIGPALGAGYMAASGNALFTEEHNGTFVSGETTSLDIFPFYLAGVVRVDVLWKDAGIPLVPYLKAGLGYALWRATNTLGTSHFDGVSGTGDSWGSYFAAGVGFNLNVFDAYAAQNFDDAMGVNATYLFAEWTREELDGIGSQKDPLRVGGTNWTFGLNFEF
jgi:hypothetical protein